MKMHAPKSHPRYLSNCFRDLLSQGVENNITSLQGLTAHGRGEAFDYLIGEKTNAYARIALKTACRLLKEARHPVLSVNGNTAVLVPKELVMLSKIIPAHLEVNLFHKSRIREKNIVALLRKHGAGEVLLPDKGIIPGIDSNRRMISSYGQLRADVIFVPLEDGDRTEALVKMGKRVITVDLNPLSRSARKASVTIVDNITRCLPLMIREMNVLNRRGYKRYNIMNYNNQLMLKQVLLHIAKRLQSLAESR